MSSPIATSAPTDLETPLHRFPSEVSSVDADVPRTIEREQSSVLAALEFLGEDVLRWVDSIFACDNTSSKPAASSALAAISGDIHALVETRQLDVSSRIDCRLDRDTPMAAEDIQPSAPFSALPASPAHATDKTRSERNNDYNSREPKINRELLALHKEGKVELWFGESGISGERYISAIHSSQWSDVIDRLNGSINSTSSKPGTPSENLAQCLRDCGVVPRKKEGMRNMSWRAPVGGMWEFSEEAWSKRKNRLADQYGKRKRTDSEEAATEEESKSNRPAARKRSALRSPSSSATAPCFPLLLPTATPASFAASLSAPAARLAPVTPVPTSTEDGAAVCWGNVAEETNRLSADSVDREEEWAEGWAFSPPRSPVPIFEADAELAL